jgi:hypothetical protein
LNAIQTVAIKNNTVVSVLGKRITDMESRVNIKEGIAGITLKMP